MEREIKFKRWHYFAIAFIVLLAGWNANELYSNQTIKNTEIKIGSDWWSDEYAIVWEMIPNAELKIHPKYEVWHNHSIVGSSPQSDEYKVWLNPEDVPDYKKQITETWRERFAATKIAEK